MIHDNDLDQRLSRALRTPFADDAADDDLAARAIAMARTNEAAAAAFQARLAAQRRRSWLLNVAAILVLAVMAAGILAVLATREPATALDAPTASTLDADDFFEHPELPDEAALLLICGGLLLTALIYVLVDAAESQRSAAWSKALAASIYEHPVNKPAVPPL